MEPQDRKWLTKEIGLEAGYRIMRFMLGTEHLHYGLFEPDIAPDIAHLKTAQERYVQRLIETIPPGVRSILDVGCGTGALAAILLDAGYEVDCVSPGRNLTAIAAERLGTRSHIHRGRFEEVEITKRYDLVLFSESFQYIPLSHGLTRSLSVLAPNGHILICDFFSRPGIGKSPIRGGHDIDRFTALHRSQPLDLLVERDITAETAPLHDINQAFVREVARPLWENGLEAADLRWPWLSRAGRWLFRSRIDELQARRLSTDRNGATFARFKIYKTYLFRRRAA